MKITFKDILEELNEISDEEIELSDFAHFDALESSKKLENKLNNDYKQAGLNGVRIEMVQPFCLERQNVCWYNIGTIYNIYLGKIQGRDYKFVVYIPSSVGQSRLETGKKLLTDEGEPVDDLIDKEVLKSASLYANIFALLYYKSSSDLWEISDAFDLFNDEPLSSSLGDICSIDYIKNSIIDRVYQELIDNPEYDTD